MYSQPVSAPGHVSGREQLQTTSGDFSEHAFHETELQCQLWGKRWVLEAAGIIRSVADPEVNQEQRSRESQPSVFTRLK